MKSMRMIRFAGNLILLVLFGVLTVTACGEQQTAPEDENVGMLAFSDSFYSMLQAKGFVNEDGTVNAMKKDESGATALHYAANSGTRDDAAILILLGADIEATDNGFSATPLLWASYDGNVDVASELVSSGANVNAQNGLGNTPLHNAAIQDNEILITVFLQAGTDQSTLNNDGKIAKELLPEGSSNAMYFH